MSDQTIRSTLSSAVGSIDHAIAALSRAEHGDARDLVARVRGDLKTTSSDLLVLRAKLCGDRTTTGQHEQFNTPFRVE